MELKESPAGDQGSFLQHSATMTSPQYDIFKQEEAELIWVESATDLESAKKRIDELSRQNDCQHVVYDQRTKRIVAVQAR